MKARFLVFGFAAIFLVGAGVINILEVQGDGYIMGSLGVGTENPRGKLDITSSNLGLVVPRVSINDVTDNHGSLAVDGTIVYDTVRKAMMFRIDGKWFGIKRDSLNNPVLRIFSDSSLEGIYTYIKASNTGTKDFFGASVALSNDNNTLAIGAPGERSIATGVNGNQNDDSAFNSGAVYVFSRSGNVWSQQAYIKASNTETGDRFGLSLALSDDGNTLAVGAREEDSNALGVNGNQNDNSAIDSGAAYVFSRSGNVWTQQAYIKASNTETGDQFGQSLTMSDDGNTLAIGAHFEDSNATGINGNQNDNSVDESGAVYVFSRSGNVWTQQAYCKASNTDTTDLFGAKVVLSGDGNTMAIGAYLEDSNAIGINGNQNDNSAVDSGAAYVFSRSGDVWTQQAYIKASNANSNDFFGLAIDLNYFGNKMISSAVQEDSNATGVNGDQNDNSAPDSGAAYVFSRSGDLWTQEAYIKASNTDSGDEFGTNISADNSGENIVISSRFESSNSTGFDGDQNNNLNPYSGAAYYFNNFNNNWQQSEYIKASNTDSSDHFGFGLTISQNSSIVVIGGFLEDSNATGINGDQSDNSAMDAGAVYIIE